MPELAAALPLAMQEAIEVIRTHRDELVAAMSSDAAAGVKAFAQEHHLPEQIVGLMGPLAQADCLPPTSLTPTSGTGNIPL